MPQRSHRGRGTSRSRVQHAPQIRRSGDSGGINARQERQTGAKRRSAKPARRGMGVGGGRSRELRSKEGGASGYLLLAPDSSPNAAPKISALITSAGAGTVHHRWKDAIPCQRSISRPSTTGMPAAASPVVQSVPPPR